MARQSAIIERNLTDKVRSSGLTRALLLGSAATACLFAPAMAAAQCAPDPVSSGDDVVCSGADTDGIYINANNVSLTVQGVISSTGDGVRMFGDDNRFTNRGIIGSRPSSSFSGSVTLGGTLSGKTRNSTTGVNEGDIFSLDGSGAALDLREGVVKFENRENATLKVDGLFRPALTFSGGFAGVFENEGTISARAGEAIFAFTSGSSGIRPRAEIVNRKSGLIHSETGSAIRNSGAGTLHVTNSGVIKGAIAVEIFADSSVTNEAGGLLEGLSGPALISSSYATHASALFINHGLIRGATSAIGGGAYVLNNSGQIFGDVAGARDNQVVFNSGDVVGNILLGDDRDVVENTGNVTGEIDLGSGSDLFRDFGGAISGRVNLGAGDDFVLVKSGGGRATIAGGILAGDGFDSFGYSVDGSETITPELVAGFEGFAIEARNKNSAATIAGGSELGFTLSAFGAGAIINLADFNLESGDAIRFYGGREGNASGGAIQIDGPFGPGVSFTNRGSITATNGFALRSAGEVSTTFTQSGGDEFVANEGAIFGAVSLGAGNDTLHNTGQIIGDVSLATPAAVSIGEDNDILRNSGLIQGNVDLGNGDDLFINSGQVTGLVDLGSGDDTYLIDITDLPPSGANPVAITAGAGFDAIGFSTRTQASVTFASVAGFEAAAAQADGVNARLEITGTAPGHSVEFLRVLGTGTVINNATMVGDVARLDIFDEKPAIAITSGVKFVNNATLGGPQAMRITGSGATITNNADLTRGSFSGDSTGNTGFIKDAGIGSTLINNGDINTTAFSTAAVYIGESTFARFGEFDYDGDVKTAARTTFINNGSLRADQDFGLDINTNFGVDVTNTGEIDDIVAERSVSGISITNSKTGVIGAISINGTSFPSTSDGSITVANDGVIQVASGPAINFRDSGGLAPLIFDDHVTNSGTIIGDILFNAGDDTFTIVGEGAVQGQVNGGADTDTLIFQDRAGELNVTNFINFEIVDVSSSTAATITSNTGDLSAFERMVIRNGRTNLATNIAVDARILETGALGGNGAISGDVTVLGAINPTAAPGALQINGALSLAKSSTLAIDANAEAVGRILATGPTTIEGGRVLYTTQNLPALDLNLAASLQFAGGRTGRFSSLDLFGAPGSRTTFGANAGFNGLFDRLAILQGTALIESTLNGAVHVGSAGVLGGNGTIVGDVTVDGLIAPGASVGALTINGNLTLGPQSLLAIETDATGTDLLTVTGNTTLAGQLALIGANPNPTRQSSIRFLNASGAVSGAFDTVTLDTAFAGLTSVNLGPSGNLVLQFTPQIGLGLDLAPAALSSATYFHNLIANGQANTASDAILTALAPLAASPGALESALRSLQPEPYASAIYAGGRQALTLSDTIRPRLTRSAIARTGVSAWLSGSDGSAEAAGDPARALSGFSTDTRATLGGVEFAGGGFLLGGYAGAIETDQSLDNQTGSTSAEGLALGAYAAANIGPAQTSLSIGYIENDATTHRAIAFMGESQSAEYDLNILTAQSDIRTEFALGSTTLTPLIGAVFAHIDRSAASEFGGFAALDLEATSEDLLYLDTGATLAKTFALDNGVALAPSNCCPHPSAPVAA